MIEDNQTSTKRLAINTVALYLRTLVLMLVALYTSRVILDVLGVEDYGVYDVVGGAIAMFGVVSGSISNAISRYITFELGKGDLVKLKDVFIASVNIQIGIGILVFVLGETIGVWFLNAYMNIPDQRMYAANWVLHCSLLAFVINLLSIPYNACIIAHEKMTAYAYIGIFDAVLRLAIVLVLPFFTFDRLIVYSILVVVEALTVRIIYAVYCNGHFEECRYKYSFNKGLIKEMAGFSGWQFLTNTCWIINNQGINILSNLFFGVIVNAARGIASQVGGAIMQFVNNFMTALTPQLVKSYAQGDKDRFFVLICRGAKFSYYLLMILAFPILIKTEYILQLWLKTVPEYSVLFVRLSILASVANMIGNTGVAACLATGNIKRYTIILSSFGILILPITWLFFYLGYPPESAYIVFLVIYTIIIFVRLYVMKGLIDFPPSLFIKKVLIPILPTTIAAMTVPIWVSYKLTDNTFCSFSIVSVICISCSLAAIWTIGITRSERLYILTSIKNKISK